MLWDVCQYSLRSRQHLGPFSGGERHIQALNLWCRDLLTVLEFRLRRRHRLLRADRSRTGR
jgi:hypothetical protein